MAVETNATYAKAFGVKQSTSVTAVKPSGTVSPVSYTHLTLPTSDLV